MISESSLLLKYQTELRQLKLLKLHRLIISVLNCLFVFEYVMYGHLWSIQRSLPTQFAMVH